MEFFLGIIVSVMMAAAWYRIFRRLGWSRWGGLTMLIAPVMFIVSGVMYFQKWPIERRIEELEQELSQRESYFPPAG